MALPHRSDAKPHGDLDAAAELEGALPALRHEAVTLQLVSQVFQLVRSAVDLDQYRAEQRRALEADPSADNLKYLDLAYWIEDRVRLALRFNLVGLHGVRMLDIGCGVGHLPCIMRLLGNEVLCVDKPDPFYKPFRTILGLPFVPLHVTAFEPLPDFGHRFAVISALGICFNAVEQEDGALRLWAPAEWDALLTDLARNQLEPGGRVVLQLNRQADWTTPAYDDAAMVRHLRTRGARGNWPYLSFAREDILATAKG